MIFFQFTLRSALKMRASITICCLPSFFFKHFYVSESKGKQLRQENEQGCFQMGKPKEMEEKQAFGLFRQQQLSHPDCSSESFHCILTTNPTLCLEKQRGRLTEIYIGLFRACTGITTVSLCVLHVGKYI